MNFVNCLSHLILEISKRWERCEWISVWPLETVGRHQIALICYKLTSSSGTALYKFEFQCYCLIVGALLCCWGKWLMKLCFFCADISPPELTLAQRLSAVHQHADRCHWKLSVHHCPDEVIRQATWTIVHACNIGSSWEHVRSDWTTSETAQNTDAWQSAWTLGVSEV